MAALNRKRTGGGQEFHICAPAVERRMAGMKLCLEVETQHTQGNTKKLAPSGSCLAGHSAELLRTFSYKNQDPIRNLIYRSSMGKAFVMVQLPH